MSVWIVKILGRVILFGSKPDQAIFVKKNLHRVNHWCHKHVNSEIVLMAIPERRSIQILLNNVAWLALVKSRLLLLWLWICIDNAGDVVTCGGIGAGVQLGCIILFFGLQEFLVLLPMLLCVWLYLRLHLVKVIWYEDTATLTPSFRLRYKEHYRFFFGILFSQLAWEQFGFALCNFLSVILGYIMQVLWE